MTSAKRLSRVVLTIGIFLISLFSSASESNLVLSKKLIEKANDEISAATSGCDFDEATKYYYEETIFFSYNQVEGIESVEQESFDDAMVIYKKMMSDCYISLFEEKTISENIEFSESKLSANFHFEAVYILKSVDGKFFESHAAGMSKFAIIDGKLRILESHHKGISFKEIATPN